MWKRGKKPARGLSSLGVFGKFWSHVLKAGISSFNTIQLNRAALTEKAQ